MPETHVISFGNKTWRINLVSRWGRGIRGDPKAFDIIKWVTRIKSHVFCLVVLFWKAVLLCSLGWRPAQCPAAFCLRAETDHGHVSPCLAKPYILLCFHVHVCSDRSYSLYFNFVSYSLYICTFFTVLCIYACTSLHVYVGAKLRLSGLVRSILTHWAISLAPFYSF